MPQRAILILEDEEAGAGTQRLVSGRNSFNGSGSL